MLLECGYTHFPCKTGQDTVDYIVQRAARKNSSGFPGLNYYNFETNVEIIIMNYNNRNVKFDNHTLQCIIMYKLITHSKEISYIVLVHTVIPQLITIAQDLLVIEIFKQNSYLKE